MKEMDAAGKALLEEFAGSIEAAFATIGKTEMTNAASIAQNKLQEAMHWFQTHILTLPAPVQAAATAVVGSIEGVASTAIADGATAIEGELIPAVVDAGIAAVTSSL